jgi:hypothetical protein
VTAETVGRVEEGEPIGPSAADEAALSADDDLPLPAVVPRPAAPGSTRLPTLDSLVAKIPPATRSALDEHLRARFMRVRKLRPGELR